MFGKFGVLYDAIETFINSKQTTQDFMSLFFVVHQQLKQGSGMLWSEVEQVLDDVLSTKEKQA